MLSAANSCISCPNTIKASIQVHPTRLCYSKHLLHIADNSQADRIFLFILIYFNYFYIKAVILLFLIGKEQLLRLCLTHFRDYYRDYLQFTA